MFWKFGPSFCNSDERWKAESYDFPIPLSVQFISHRLAAISMSNYVSRFSVIVYFWFVLALQSPLTRWLLDCPRTTSPRNAHAPAATSRAEWTVLCASSWINFYLLLQPFLLHVIVFVGCHALFNCSVKLRRKSRIRNNMVDRLGMPILFIC